MLKNPRKILSGYDALKTSEEETSTTMTPITTSRATWTRDSKRWSNAKVESKLGTNSSTWLC
jgi:hypothetical protein